MYILKLVKGLSCKVGKVRATSVHPEVEIHDKQSAENALATGYFELVSYTDEKNNEDIPLQKMTEKQLEVYAAENNINLAGCKNKAEKLAKATATVEVDEEKLNENTGEPDFGEGE